MREQAIQEKVYCICIASLEEYLRKIKEEHDFTTKQMEKLMEDYHIDSLLAESFEEDEKRKAFRWLDIFQNIHNVQLKEEISNLAVCAYANNVKLIILKGVVFSEQYYLHPEKRRSGDIDVFIAPEEFVKFINICMECGYRLRDGNEIDTYIVREYLEDYLRDQHFNVLSKRVGNSIIDMDIHLALIQHHWFSGMVNNIPSDFWQRAMPAENIDINHIYELEKHDMIIYLCLHFLQHFYKRVWRGFILGDHVLGKNLHLLFDLACLINTKSSEIDWCYFCKLCHVYLLDSEIANVLSFVCQIFGNIVPQFVINELDTCGRGYEKERFYASICKYVMCLDLKYMLVNPVQSWLGGWLNAVKNSKNTIFCFRHSCSLMFKSRYAFGYKSVAESMKFIIGLTWNERGLVFEMDVKYDDSPLTIVPKTGDDQSHTDNGIMVGIYDFDNGIIPFKVVSFCISYKVTKLGNVFYSSDKLLKISVTNERLTVEIPWVAIGFPPFPGKTFGLNIVWTHFVTEIEYARVSLSGNPVWHDVAGMYQISLAM